MLSFSKVKSAKNAGHYFMETDNYYLRSDEYASRFQWWGKGAAKLGLLDKPINQDDFLDLLHGMLPNGEKLPIGANGTRRVGFDLTFSAPKSASLLALVYKDTRIIDAHQAAVDVALAEIEKEAAQVRINIKGTKEYIFERTNNLTVAKFLHDVSREMDPQLHTHCVVMNFTERLDGKWRALASKARNERNGHFGVVDGFYESIYERQIYFGIIYRAELARRLVEMGYEIEVSPDKKYGMFEIKGIPSEVLQMFSKRREQVMGLLQKLGYSSPSAADYAAQSSRQAKADELVDREELRNYWKEQVNTNFQDFDPEKLIRIAKKLEPPKIDPNAAKNAAALEAARIAVMEASRHFAEVKLSFNHSDLIAQSLIFAIGKARFHDVNKAIKQLKDENFLVPLSGHELTTTELISFESKVIEQVKGFKGKAATTQVKPEILNLLVGSDDQKKAVVEILASKNNAVMVNMSLYEEPEHFLETLLNAAESGGSRIKILSTRRGDSNQLNKEVQRKSFNAWQWVVNHFKPELAQTVRGYLYKNKNDAFDKLNAGHDILVVDQAHRMGYDDFEALLKHSEDQNTKLVFLNSSEGFKGLSAGNPMELLRKAQVQEISLKTANAPKSHLTAAVLEVKEDEARAKVIADKYTALTEGERRDTHIIAHTKQQVAAINQNIRAGLKNKGAIDHAEKSLTILTPVSTSKETIKFAGTYKPGMVVKRFIEDKAKDTTTVMEYRVLKHIEDDNIVKLADSKGEAIRWNPKKERWQTQLFVQEELSLSAGDRMVATANMGRFGISPGDHIRIDRLWGPIVSLNNLTKKQVTNTTLGSIANGSFKYAYTSNLSNIANERRSNVILDIKGFAANQGVLHEVQSHAGKSLDILTDNAEKLQTHIVKEQIKLTTLDTLITRSTEVADMQKYIDAKTLETVQKDIEQIANCLKEKYGDLDRRTLVQQSLDFAVEKLSEREAAFKHDTLVIEAIVKGLSKIKPGSEVTHQSITDELARYKAEGKLFLAPEGTYWVTKEALEYERGILQMLKDTKDTKVALCDSAPLKEDLGKAKLTKGQQDAAHLILTTKDQFVMVQGDAGTGKTSMLSQVTKELLIHLQQTLKDSGSAIEVMGVAPSHQAVKEIKEVGIEAQTLKSFLIDCEQDVASKGNLDLSNKLLVLDEYSMVSNKDAFEFMEVVKKYNGRAVKIGDIKQFESIPAGRPMMVEYTSGAIKVAHMDEIVRQENVDALNIAKHAAKGMVRDAIRVAESVNAVDYIERDATRMTMQEQVQLKNSVIQSKKDRLEQDVATEYLSRTPAAREQSSFIVQTHGNREKINSLIREGLKTHGELVEHGVSVNRLVPLDLTKAEIKEVSPLMTKKATHIKLGNKYYTILEMDADHHCLWLKDEAGNQKAIHLKRDLSRYHDNIEVFEHRQAEVCKHDLIMIKKSNPALGIFGNNEYVVLNHNQETLTLKNKKDGKVLDLDTAVLNQTHWDYAYTKTGYSEQGATHLYTVDVRFSSDDNLSNVRSAYISLTRHKRHYMLFTDNKKQIIEKLVRPKDKISALDALNELTPDPKRNETKPTSLTIAEQQANSTVVKRVSTRWNYKAINDALMMQAEEVYTAILGEPKQKQGATWRWPNGLVVTVRGSKAGLWNWFAEKKGGAPIQAIQYFMGMSHGEALKYGASLAGLTENQAIITTEHIETHQKKIAQNKVVRKQLEEAEVAKKIEVGQSIWAGTVPVQGTLAERYFKEHRKIDSLDNMEIRFWPPGAKWVDYDEKTGERFDRVNKAPVAVLMAKNEKGEVTGVQRIYLDPKTAGKNKGMPDPKLSKGLIKGSAGIVQLGKPRGKLYLAEGPETAASIAMVDPEATVLTSFSVGNLANLVQAVRRYKPSEVILAGDNDGRNPETGEPSHTYKTTEEAVREFKERGVNIKSIYPKDIPGMPKADWNDVLKVHGVRGLKMQLRIPEKSGTFDLGLDDLHQQQKSLGEEPIIINPGSKEKKVSFITDKLDNARSIEAAAPGHQVIANGSKGFKALDTARLPKTIIICLDNIEGAADQKQVEAMAEHFKTAQKEVFVTLPEKAGTSFKEIFKKEGAAKTCEALGNIIPVDHFIAAPNKYLTDNMTRIANKISKDNQMDLSKLRQHDLNKLVELANTPPARKMPMPPKEYQFVKMKTGDREL